MKRILLTVCCLALMPMLINAQERGSVPDSLVLQLQRATGDDYQRAKALENIVDYYIDNNEFECAKPYVEEVNRIAESLNSNYIKTLSCYYTIVFFNKANNHDAVIPYIYEARALLDRLDDTDECNRMRLNVYDILAKFYYTYNMLPQAFENLNLCFRINEKLNAKSIDFNLNRRLMMLYIAMHKYRESIDLGKQLAGYEVKGINLTYYYIEMMESYAGCDIIDTALCYADSALWSDTSGKLNWLINDQKGQILLNNDLYDEAKACFDQERGVLGENYIQPEDSLYIVFRTRWSQAVYYNHLHRYDSALFYADCSLEAVRAYVSLVDECEIMALKTDILRNAGRYEEALDNMTATQTLNDSLNQVKSIQSVESLMFQQQMKDYEAEQQYESYRREQRQRMHFTIMAFVATLFLLGMVILLLIINKRRLQHKVTEEELEARNRELTEAAVVMMKKNEAYAEVINQLKELKDATPDREAKKALERVSKKIEQTMEDGYYEEFSLRFKEVHPDFIEKLTKKHPDLTPNEVKICSFLKLNMSTKEISALTGQSIPAIEMARFRIRRKLGIDRDEHWHLSNYINRI